MGVYDKAILTENTMFFQGGNEYLYNVFSTWSMRVSLVGRGRP